MRLLVIGHPFFLAYHQRKYVAMKRLGVEVRLVVPNRGRDRFDLTECELHPALTQDEVIPLPAWLAGSHTTYVHPPARLARILREFQPDVIHIEEDPQFFITLEAIALQRIFAAKAKVTLFTWDNILRPRRFPLGWIKARLRTYSLHRAAAVMCGNSEAAELLREEERFKGLIEVLPQYGLDPEEFQPGNEPQLRFELGLADHIVIGYIGRLVPEKGLHLLREALNSLQNRPCKLLLVGAGPLEKEIRECWMPKFTGRIVLVAAVPYDQAARYLRCMDIFVLPSLTTPKWKEQFGLALAQAMMLGKACVGSSCGAIPEVLGPDGIVFREGDKEQLALVLKSLLDSPVRREEIGLRLRQLALHRYVLQCVTAGYLGVFGSVAGITSQLDDQDRAVVSVDCMAGRKV